MDGRNATLAGGASGLRFLSCVTPIVALPRAPADRAILSDRAASRFRWDANLVRALMLEPDIEVERIPLYDEKRP